MIQLDASSLNIPQEFLFVFFLLLNYFCIGFVLFTFIFQSFPEFWLGSDGPYISIMTIQKLLVNKTFLLVELFYVISITIIMTLNFNKCSIHESLNQAVESDWLIKIEKKLLKKHKNIKFILESMLKNANIVWTPLKQPFIPFVINQRPRRPSSSKSNYSHLINQANHACQTQNNYSISQDNQNDRPVNYVQMLEDSKNKTKTCLDQDATQLRQQVWLKIESTFRKIWQYGEQFYQSLSTVITHMTSQHPYSTNPSNKLICTSIQKCLQNNQCLYNKQRMEKITRHIVDKMEKYLEEILQRYLGNLFHLSDEMNRIKNNSSFNVRKDDYIQTERIKNPQINRRNYQQKSMSAQKFYSRPDKQTDTNQNKDKQFQQISDRIKQNKQTNKPTTTNPNNTKTLDNPYGLNIQTGKFIQNIDTVPNFNNTYFSYKNSRQNSRAPHSVSKVNTTIKNRSRNLNMNNISISPVLSRVSVPQIKRQFASYKVSLNQQSITCQWCQQLKLTPEPKKTPINKITPILSLTNTVTKNTDDTAICLTFCNNFTNIAIGCKSSLIYIYELQSGEELNRQVTRLQGHSAAICCLYEHLGLLFSGGDIGCNSIYIWDIATWTVRSKLNYHSAAVCSISAIPNTDYIFSCSLDRTIKLYNYQTSQITSHHKSQASYVKLVYFQQEQIVAVMTPGVNVDIFGVDLGDEEYRLVERKGIVCGSKIGMIEKSGCGDHVELVVGLLSGGIQLYNIGDGTLIKRIEFGICPIASLITFNRNNKSQYPIILYACIGSVVFHTINTETQFTTQLNVRGNIDFQVGCGVGPLMVVNDRCELAWISQRQYGSQFFISSFSIH